MNKQFQSFVTFTRTEKTGIAALCGIICLLIIIKFTMHLWVHPSIDNAQEKKLQQAWEEFQSTNTTTDSAFLEKANSSKKKEVPDSVDINTADSSTLLLFKRIGPATAHKILELRKKSGPFTDISQINECGSFSKEELQVLRAHLRLPASDKTGR